MNVFRVVTRQWRIPISYFLERREKSVIIFCTFCSNNSENRGKSEAYFVT